MYLGTDAKGNQSPPTRFVTQRDYGRFPISPDKDKPYHGPGYRLDWPDNSGNCATCHAPAAAINKPFSTHMGELDEVGAEGVNCDFCHKIAAVALDDETGLPLPNRPGTLSYEFHRPPDQHQYFASPFADARGGGSFVPAYRESQYCAPCHHAVFWDTVVYDSYGEWLASDFSHPETGRTCQSCHMTPRGTEVFALPSVGGVEHPPEEVFSHDMSIAKLLTSSATMVVSAEIKGGALEVTVGINNDQTGHHLPTGSPMRHLILVVEAKDEAG
ncbi:MAG: hypothetical protein HN348_09440, partial [Proteobacteria bacterium]|nr:hypothetical protein [Pseudomonadota bacterium]